MSNLHTLRPAPGSRRPRRRVGRGDGSNRGSYSGRGSKGQKQHGKVPHLFEGGQLRIVKRLPHMRGFTNRFRTEYTPVNVASLDKTFDDGADVSPTDIYDHRLVRRRGDLIKLLGTGDISKPLNVTVHACSDSARQKIEAAGGSVTVLGPDVKPDKSSQLDAPQADADESEAEAESAADEDDAAPEETAAMAADASDDDVADATADDTDADASAADDDGDATEEDADDGADADETEPAMSADEETEADADEEDADPADAADDDDADTDSAEASEDAEPADDDTDGNDDDDADDDDESAKASDKA